MYWMGATGSLAVVLSGAGFRGGSYRELSAGAILHLLRGRGEVQPRCLYVMAGLSRPIHAFARCTENVDARPSPRRSGFGRAGGTSPGMTTVQSHPISDIDRRAQRMFLDEVAARLDHLAHQLGEDVVGLVDLLDLHLEQ